MANDIEHFFHLFICCLCIFNEMFGQIFCSVFFLFLVLSCLFFFLLLYGATLALWKYGNSQARGQIWATAPGLCHSHSNVGSELQPTPQLRATLDPRSTSRDQTSILMDTSLSLFCCTTMLTPFVHFQIGFCAVFSLLFFFFILLSFESSFYVPDSSLFLGKWFESIFSQSVGFLFTLLECLSQSKYFYFDEAQFIKIFFYNLCFWCRL